MSSKKQELLKAKRKILKAAYDLAVAKASFHGFVQVLHKRVFGTRFITSRFSESICNALEQFAYAVMLQKEEKEQNNIVPTKRARMQLYAPPQHGKSIVLKMFTAWCFWKWPHIKIVSASYGADLALQVSRETQLIMDSAYYKAHFYEAFDYSTPKSAGSFMTKDKGMYLVVGIGGPLTGRSYDIGIIDDPYKDRPSAADKRAVEHWYDDVFLTRIADHSGQILLMTRWAVDDLADYLAKKPSKVEVPLDNGTVLEVDVSWKIHLYKAINDRGEALTEHKGLSFLLEQKASMPAARWASLYQQSPIVEGGGLIKVKNFNYYKMIPSKGWKDSFIIIDSAIGESKVSDYTVMAKFGVSHDHNLYIEDLKRGRWDMLESVRQIRAFMNKHAEHKIFLEVVAANASRSLFQALRQAKIPVQVISPKGKKKAERVDIITQYIDSGYFYINETGEWVADFLSECEAFTYDDSHPHDDQVDVLTFAAERTFIDKAANVDMIIL